MSLVRDPKRHGLVRKWLRKWKRRRVVRRVSYWDEFSQGYDDRGRVIVCICGKLEPGDQHKCPYDVTLERVHFDEIP